MPTLVPLTNLGLASDSSVATAISGGTATPSALATVLAPYALTTSLSSYAPLASPALTGNPTAPTPTAGDNDTSIATTAFVHTAVAGVTPSDTGWVALTLTGCTNLDTVHYSPAQYRIVGGQVFLRGVVSYTTGISVNTVFANGTSAIATAYSYTILNANLNGTPRRLDVQSNGDIVWADATVTSGWYASLDGVTYRKD